jgi:hypothetical protein
MKKLFTRRTLFIAILVALPIVMGFTSPGCDTPPAVRSFSNEQVKVQEQFGQTLAEHFTVVESFADAQLAVTNWRVDQITKQIQQAYVDRTRAVLDADPNLTQAQKDKILMDMAAAVAADSANNEANKRRIAELVDNLKQTDREILAAQAEIAQATRQMNEWVQLQKTDELLWVRLSDKMKGAQDKLTSAMSKANKFWTELTGLLPKGK